MKIGITERGDAGLNMAWVNKLNSVDGAILITKNITKEFVENVLETHDKGYKLIVHCTCTGYGNSELEPNVPNYKAQLNSLKFLIDMGFPAERCVLRIDPIFPSEKGLARVRQVIEYFRSLNTGITRIRVSIVDEYKHVKERYRQRGWHCLYDGFSPSREQLLATAKVLNELNSDYSYKYETCAEDGLGLLLISQETIGCISYKDIKLMDIPMLKQDWQENPQNRKGCHCLSCKTELLTERKPCPNGCVYCFWKN